MSTILIGTQGSGNRTKERPFIPGLKNTGLSGLLTVKYRSGQPEG